MGFIVAIRWGVFKVAPRTAGGYTHRIVCVRKTGAPFS